MKKVSTLLILTTFCLWVERTAFADWTQHWEQASWEIYQGHEVGPFDQMAIWGINGTTFQNPAFSNFNDSGWSTFNNATNDNAYALSLEPKTDIQFDMTYATASGVGDFLYMASLGCEVKQRQHVIFSGGAWSYPEFTGTDEEWHELGGGDPFCIPEPVTILLLLAGLMTMRLVKKA